MQNPGYFLHDRGLYLHTVRFEPEIKIPSCKDPPGAHGAGGGSALSRPYLLAILRQLCENAYYVTAFTFIMEELTAALCLLSLGLFILSVVMKRRSVAVSMVGLLMTILAITKSVQDPELGDDLNFVIFPLMAVLLLNIAMIAWPERSGW